MEPTADHPDAEGRLRRQRAWLIAASLAIVALVVALVAVLLIDDDDEDDVTTGTTTTAVEDTTSTTTEDTATTSETSTTTTQPGEGDLPDEEATIVWPAPDSGVDHEDALDAVRGFAEDFVGFTDPVYSEFMQGDSRSGEVEIRPFEDGAVTTVFVRQMSDDNWYVTGSATDDIDLEQPAIGEEIRDPLEVSGEARAFEGMVTVAVHALGETEPLGEGTLTAGGGGDLVPFEGQIDYEPTDDEHGVVLVTTSSGRDGGPSTVAALPVGFASQG